MWEERYVSYWQQSDTSGSVSNASEWELPCWAPIHRYGTILTQLRTGQNMKLFTEGMAQYRFAQYGFVEHIHGGVFNLQLQRSSPLLTCESPPFSSLPLTYADSPTGLSWGCLFSLFDWYFTLFKNSPLPPQCLAVLLEENTPIHRLKPYLLIYDWRGIQHELD